MSTKPELQTNGGTPDGSGALTMDEVRMAVAGLIAPWTVDQLCRAVHRDESEVDGYVQRLLEGHTIQDMGASSKESGSGPAPRLYGPVIT